MSKSKPLTAEALARLGAERLAALLLDAAEHDAALARTLRIAVASRDGADSAAEIKRLKRGKGFIDRDRTRAFARDLSALCTAIEGPLADADPVMALERWVCSSAAQLAARAAPALPPERAAFRAYQTYLCDDYGVADRIIADFAQALDSPARAALQSWIEAELEHLPLPADPNSATGWIGEWKLIYALADIANAKGDVDTHCAAQQRLRPRVRDDAGMARRLLDAGRAAEAYAVIEAAEPNPAKAISRSPIFGSRP